MQNCLLMYESRSGLNHMINTIQITKCLIILIAFRHWHLFMPEPLGLLAQLAHLAI